MPYRLGWYIENKVVYLDLIGEISGDEYKEAIANIIKASEEIGNIPLHTLADNRHLEKWPNLTSLTGITMPENRGWVISVGVSNGLLKFLSSTAGQLLRLDMKMVNDISEAIQVLQRVDPELQDTELPQSFEHVQWFAASSPDLLDSTTESLNNKS
jgi:hypothetical protein